MQNSTSASLFIAVLMVFAGVMTGLQPATNGMLTRTMNSP